MKSRFLGLAWETSHFLGTNPSFSSLLAPNIVCFMLSHLCLRFCFSLQFTLLIYLLSKLILHFFFFSESHPLEDFLGHLRKLNVSFSYLPSADNFCFMAGRHLVQLFSIALRVFLGNSSIGHTHWGINLGALPFLAKWQRCGPR